MSFTDHRHCSNCITDVYLIIVSLYQDVLLCGVYARREAAYGNIVHARKIFDMALSSICGMPLVCFFRPFLSFLHCSCC